VDFALDFVTRLAGMLLDAAPVLVLLLLLIVGLAILIGRGEGWSVSDSIYFGFVTGTTVGYGDFRPKRLAGKAMAIVIAYIGLIQIGIIVALAVHAAAEAYRARDGLALGALPSSAEHPRGTHLDGRPGPIRRSAQVSQPTAWLPRMDRLHGNHSRCLWGGGGPGRIRTCDNTVMSGAF
jgi:Ion channel